MSESQDMAEVLSAAAHDIRSRLWVIMSALETFASGDAAAARAEARWVGHVARTADRLLELADALGLLSRLERAELELDRRPMSLEVATAAAVELAKLECDLTGPGIVVRVPRDLYVRGDGTYLPYAISRVLTRSACMSREQVVVEATRAEGFVSLSLRPDRSGAPRVARRVSAEWMLADKLIRAHGGVLEIEPADGEEPTEICFRIELPMAC